MNNITIVGRLTKDPELKYIPSTGTAVCTFDVAVDRGRKDKNGNSEVDFFRVETFGKTAEACANYTGRGCWIAVGGSSISDRYQDKNGNNRVSWKVRASEIKFITYRDDNNQSNNGQFQQAPMNNNGQPQFQQAPMNNNGQPQWGAMDDIGDDDVPF